MIINSGRAQVNFTKGCSALTRAIASRSAGAWGGSPSMDIPPRPVTLTRLNLALSPPSGGRGAKEGLGPRDSFAQRRGLGREPQYGYTTPARDFAIA